MTNDDKGPPEWAFARANELAVKYGMEDEKGRVFDGPYTRPLQVAFARYIAEHEEPPFDPLLIEAREIAATHRSAWADEFRSGKYDETSTEIPVALTALRRGIELARKEDSHAG